MKIIYLIMAVVVVVVFFVSCIITYQFSISCVLFEKYIHLTKKPSN